MLRVCHVHIADDVNNPAVGLLWQALILTTITSLHVEDGNMQALGTNYAQATVGITQYQYSIRLGFNHHLIGFVDDVTHRRTKVITYSFHIDIRISQLQILKEHPIEVIVIVLPSMCQQTVKVLTALVNYRRQTDNLRTRTNYYQKLQLPILFKFCHFY